MWLPLVMGGMSMLQANEQQKNQQRAQSANMKANAAAMEYSPWTGMGKEMIQAQPGGGMSDVLAKGIQGGMMGAMFKQKNPGLFGGGEDAAHAAKAAEADAFAAGIGSQPRGPQASATQSPWGAMTMNTRQRPSMYGYGQMPT